MAVPASDCGKQDSRDRRSRQRHALALALVAPLVLAAGSGAALDVGISAGMWCSQSTNIVHSLLRLGYPAHRLKWYRGGMQSWESVGLSTVRATS